MKRKSLIIAALCLSLAGCSYVQQFVRPTPPAALVKAAPAIPECECKDEGELLRWADALVTQYGEIAVQLDGLSRWATGKQ